MSDDCPCVFPPNGYNVPPEDGFPDQCFNESPDGMVCTRQPGHNGAHVACNPLTGEHQIDVWVPER